MSAVAFPCAVLLGPCFGSRLQRRRGNLVVVVAGQSLIAGVDQQFHARVGVKQCVDASGPGGGEVCRPRLASRQRGSKARSDRLPRVRAALAAVLGCPDLLTPAGTRLRGYWSLLPGDPSQALDLST